MSDSLATYLHEHLAGSNFAIELLESLRDRPGLGAFAAQLLADVREDRKAIERIIQQVGKNHLDLREATAWLAEKASKFKLRHDDPRGLGTFEALEMLTLGILGKLALWRAMPVIAEVDTRVRQNDFDKLAARAEEQFARAEKRRLQLARSAFRAVSTTRSI